MSYGTLLRTDIPVDTHLVGNADVVAALVTARTAEVAQLSLDMVMGKCNWVEETTACRWHVRC